MEEVKLSGILLMNKPEGFTSHDVVAKLRGILKTKKIGHGGTLDPMATGVLPVFIGGATKAADFAASQNKAYRAGFSLGFRTDTQDTTGTILEKGEKKAKYHEVEQAVCSFLGAGKQIPPMYSAVKIDGQKLYNLARKGKEIERPAKDIFIHEIKMESFDEQTQKGELYLKVSKGTYVRTIIDDLGEKLGTFAAMNALTRVSAGEYALSQCVSFETVQKAMENGTMQQLLLKTDSLFSEYPSVFLSEEGAERAKRGAIVFPRQAKNMPEKAEEICKVYFGETFLMLGKVRELDKGGLGLFVYKNFR